MKFNINDEPNWREIRAQKQRELNEIVARFADSLPETPLLDNWMPVYPVDWDVELIKLMGEGK